MSTRLCGNVAGPVKGSHMHIWAEMESSRPWPWPRGASRTTGHVLGLGLGGQVLGLGLRRRVLGIGLGLGKHVLGLKYFSVLWLKVTVNFITNFENLAIKMKLVITSPAINVCVLKLWLNSEPLALTPALALALEAKSFSLEAKSLALRVVVLTPSLHMGCSNITTFTTVLTVSKTNTDIMICRANTSQDHSWAPQDCIWRPHKDWQCRSGRLRQTWLRMVEDDLNPLNFDLETARWHAWDRLAWWLLMQAATSSWHAPDRKRIPVLLPNQQC